MFSILLFSVANLKKLLLSFHILLTHFSVANKNTIALVVTHFSVKNKNPIASSTSCSPFT
jgi:hypothetical protein